jgi:hypothetical protein
MRKLKLLFVFLLLSIYSSAQNPDTISLSFFKKGEKKSIDYKLVMISNDTTFVNPNKFILREDIGKYSIRICAKNIRLLLSPREDSVQYINIFLDKRTYGKFNSTKFPIKNPTKKYYYIDYGINVMIRIGRSNNRNCKLVFNQTMSW